MNTKAKICAVLLAVIALPAIALANHLDGGFVSFGGGSLVIGGSGHHHETFSHHGNVPWVDDHGTAVDYHTLQPGHPMTVHYSEHNHQRIVDRVVVHQRHGRHH